MASRVRVRPRANRDLIEQARFIAHRDLAAAHRFLDAAEAAFDRLSRVPGLGSPRASREPRLTGIRVWPIPGFERHLVFYRTDGKVIDVVRVLHAARDFGKIL